MIDYKDFILVSNRVTRPLEKNEPNFLKIAQKVTKSKKAKISTSSIGKPKTSTTNHALKLLI
jgi:hypothetical protein